MIRRHRYRNLVELGEESCKKFADRPLFGTRSKDGSYVWTTYREFQALVDAARGGLAALGVRTGDKVAIVSNNRLEWAVAAYATYGLGATFVPMYEAQRPEEWAVHPRRLRREGRLRLQRRSVVNALEAMQAEPPAAHARHRDRTAARRRSTATLAAPRAGAHGAGPVDLARRPQSIAGFIYTSGTTGKPKGVMLTHGNITSNIHAVHAMLPVRRTEDRTLSFLPWAHVVRPGLRAPRCSSASAPRWPSPTERSEARRRTSPRCSRRCSWPCRASSTASTTA